jgi:hypothetical protein
MNVEDITFEIVGTGNMGKLQVSSIWLGDKEIGQERVYYDKPFEMVDGQLMPTEPKYQYLDWNLSVGWDEELSDPGDFPMFVSPDEDEDGKGFKTPGWSSMEKFEKHLVKTLG